MYTVLIDMDTRVPRSWTRNTATAICIPTIITAIIITIVIILRHSHIAHLYSDPSGTHSFPHHTTHIRRHVHYAEPSNPAIYIWSSYDIRPRYPLCISFSLHLNANLLLQDHHVRVKAPSAPRYPTATASNTSPLATSSVNLSPRIQPDPPRLSSPLCPPGRSSHSQHV
jgi:hypothetical protein